MRRFLVLPLLSLASSALAQAPPPANFPGTPPPAPPAVIRDLSADPATIGAGQSTTLRWEALKITERYTRVADDLIDYRMTVDDPQTWTAPWTMQFPLRRDDGYGMFEYACHEGNLAMFNILSGARADERAAAGSR